MDKLKRITKKVGTPFFVYEEKVLEENMNRIKEALQQNKLEDKVSIYTAYFCNSNPHLHKILSKLGAGVVLQAREELEQIIALDLQCNKVVSPSFLSNQEIDYWVAEGIELNLASLEEVKYFIENHADKKLNFRLDLTRKGTQRTAIKKWQIQELKDILEKSSTTPNSFHVYPGTGSSIKKMVKNLHKTIKIYKKYFPEVKEINLGGGFGFDYEKEEHFDWNKYFSVLQKIITKQNINDVSFVIEPGRDVFVDSGSFLVSTKRIIKGRKFDNISTDGSFVHMPSATIRKRKHNVEFFDEKGNKLVIGRKKGKPSGSTTLSSDYMFLDKINIPNNLEEGFFIRIKDIGAYGATQHMEFLNQRPCPEVLITKEGKIKLISKRGEYTDKIRNVPLSPQEVG